MHTNILWECGNIWLQSICNNTAYSGRGQWCASIRGACSLGTMAAPRHSNVEKLLQKIEESQMGYNSTLQGPFGIKRGTCMIACRQIDWTIDLHHMHNSPSHHTYTHSCVHRLHCIWKVSVFPTAKCTNQRSDLQLRHIHVYMCSYAYWKHSCMLIMI